MTDPKSPESQTNVVAPDVGRQMRRGLSWNLAGAITTNAMRVVVIAILGRALTSADFGIVAAASSVNVILYGIRDIGIGRALIQRKELRPGHLQTAFAVSTYIGVGSMTLLVAAAPMIGRFFSIESSVNVIRALAVLFAVRGVGSTSRMMSERTMRFNAIAIIDAGSFALGSITAMVAAVQGAGPWSLVLGYIVEEGLSTLAYLVLSPPQVSLRIDRTCLRELMSYGIGQTITQITGMLATNGDNLVVGHVLGAKLLGFYARAYDLIKLPAFAFEAIVGRVLFPAFSRLQDDRARIGGMFTRVLFANALVLFPASAALIVLAPEVIRILVGKGWDSSVVPLQILAVTILPRTSQKLGAIVTQAAGRANAMALAHTIYMIVVIGGAAIAIRWGIVGVAVSTAFAIVVVFAQSLWLGMTVCEVSLRAVVVAHVPGLALAGLVVATVLPLATVLRGSSSFVVVVVVALAAAGVVCLAAIAVLLRRKRGHFAWLRDELMRLRGRRAPRGVA
ncbi:MAG: lipopolysaccharide biosynthesis protein [Proteobacteria bacterium]|nr:lipopolysaccharide biosynthesis protein [Pseudomonadota bacterium]